MTHINEQAEQALVGFVLALQENHTLVDQIDPKLFASQLAARVAKQIARCAADGNTVDMLTLYTQYQVSKEDMVSCLAQTSSTSWESAYYIVIDNHAKREAQNLGRSVDEFLKSPGAGQKYAETMQGLLDKYNDRVDHDMGLTKISSVITNYMGYLSRSEQSQSNYIVGVSAFSTGAGLGSVPITIEQGHLVTVVARAKSGKTTLMTQMALEAEEQGATVLIVTLEIKEREMFERIMALAIDKNPIALKPTYGKLNDAEKAKRYENVRNAITALEGKNITIADDSNLASLSSKIESMAKKSDKVIVFIDQLQFIDAQGKFRAKHEEYDYILKRLKKVADRTKASIVLAHQMNREIEKRDGKYPKTSDIKDSGRVEEISDMIIMFQKPHDSEIRACTVVNRHAPGGRYDLAWDQKKAKFI